MTKKDREGVWGEQHKERRKIVCKVERREPRERE